MFGSKAKAYHFKRTEGEDSDTEDIQCQIWGLNIQPESSSDEESDEGSELGSSCPSLPADGNCLTDLFRVLSSSCNAQTRMWRDTAFHVASFGSIQQFCSVL